MATVLTIFPKLYHRDCTNQRNHNQNRENFSFSRSWPWAYFLNGPNAAAPIAPCAGTARAAARL